MNLFIDIEKSDIGTDWSKIERESRLARIAEEIFVKLAADDFRDEHWSMTDMAEYALKAATAFVETLEKQEAEK